MKAPVTVSENTMNFVNCLLALSDLQTKAYNAMQAIYGKHVDDSLMDEFMDKCQLVRELLDKYMLVSIQENIYNNEFSEI